MSVANGEVLALLGANGAGKTTTLRSILGLTRPRRGSIRFSGKDITLSPTHAIARAGICWVPDDRRLCPTLTVAKNLRIATKKTPFRGWTLDETFSIFSPLEHLMHREAENLSGGEMQMVSIARALLGSPGLVLFDEPSQGLAPKIVADVLATVRRLKTGGRCRQSSSSRMRRLRYQSPITQLFSTAASSPGRAMPQRSATTMRYVNDCSEPDHDDGRQRAADFASEPAQGLHTRHALRASRPSRSRRISPSTAPALSVSSGPTAPARRRCSR